jgi:hypothetical protein
MNYYRSLPSESSALFLYSLLQSHGTFTDVLIRSGMSASGLLVHGVCAVVTEVSLQNQIVRKLRQLFVASY